MTETTVRRICVACWQLWPTLACWSGAIVSLVVIEGVSTAPCRWDGPILGAYLARAGKGGDAWLLDHGSKPLFGRGRPDLFTALVELPANAPYLSAHSAQIFAFALSLCLTLRPAVPGSAHLLGILLCWAAAVGLSRVYLQVCATSPTWSAALCWPYFGLGARAFSEYLGNTSEVNHAQQILGYRPERLPSAA